MAGALIGALRVTLGLDASYFEEGTKGATRAARKLEKDLRETGRSLTQAGQRLTIGLTAPLTALGVESVKAAMESRDALAQVENTLKTMGDAAGYTADQLKALASNQMHDSLYDDDEILRSLTNTLLTFGKVADEEFARAQQAALDLSAKFGKDLQGSAILVGKALQDPIKGLTALSRVGISFSAQQKAQIKDMVEAGRVADAQRLILSELERQVSGSAKAAAEANPMTALKHAWDDFKEGVGEQLLQVLPPVIDAIKSVLAAFASLSPEMQKWVVIGGIAAAALGPFLMAIGGVVSLLATMVPQMIAFGAAVSSVVAATGAGGGVMAALGASLGIVLKFLGPIGLALSAIYAIWKNWDTIAPILADLAEKVKGALGPPIKSMIEALSNALTALWQGPFGDLLRLVLPIIGKFAAVFAGAFGEYAVHIIEQLAYVIGGAFEAIAGLINMVAGLLMGDWAGAWEGAKQVVVGVASALLHTLEALLPGSLAALRALYEGVKEWLGRKVTEEFNKVKSGIEAVTAAFGWMYDKVVGHSYVPDMVKGIASWMSQLDTVMVGQAKGAAKSTADVFRQMQQEVRALFGELFPEAEELNEYQRRLGLLSRARAAGEISKDQEDAARIEMAKQRSQQGWSERDRERDRVGGLIGGEEPLVSNTGVDAQLDEFAKRLEEAEEDTQDKTSKMIIHFAEMARDIVGSMRGMVDAFKKGDILGGIMGVLDMVAQIAGAISGIKGTTITTRSAIPTGFSTGGSFKVGGSGGVDSKLVQFRATPGEMVDVRRPGALAPANDVIVVHVDKSDLFNVAVERVAAPLAQRASMQGAALGAALSQREGSRMERNTL